MGEFQVDEVPFWERRRRAGVTHRERGGTTTNSTDGGAVGGRRENKLSRKQLRQVERARL